MKNSKIVPAFLSIVFLFSVIVQAATINVSLDPADWSPLDTLTSSYSKQNIGGNLRFTCNTYRGYISFRSNDTFNLQGGTIRYKWRMYASGSYNYCWSNDGINVVNGFGRYFNLHHVWSVGILVSANTWIYTELIFNPDKTYSWNYSYTGYGNGGIFTGSGTLSDAQYDALANAFVLKRGGDNYTTPFYFEFGEIQIFQQYQPLIVDINTPATESCFEPNEIITFDSDTSGGEEPITYEWSSDIDGILSDLDTFDISTLSLGGHHITLTCQDSNSYIATDSIYIYVVQPPIIDAIDDETIPQGVPYSGPQPVLSQGDFVTWQLAAAPAGMTINPSTGVVSWPNPEFSETGITVTIEAVNCVGSSQQSWQLFVLRPPVIADITDESIIINDAYTGPVPVLTQGALPIVWSLISAPAGMTIDANTGQVNWPSASIEGVHTITIRATNVVGSDDESWQLKVWAPPVVAEIADHAVTESVEYNGPAPALSSGTTPVSWSLDAGPAGMTIAANGVVTWLDPQPEDSEHTVTITAINLAGSDSESWSIRVMVPPQIDTISDEIVHEGTAYTGPVPQLLAGTAPITWSIVSGPSGLTINPSTGVVSWANVDGSASPYTITIRASNAVGNSQQSWQLTVLRPPLIMPISDISVAVGSAYTGPMPGLYKGSPPISWSLVTGPGGMTIDDTNGIVNWLTVVSGGPYNIVIEASNIVGSDTKSWILTAIDPPVIADITNMVVPADTPFTSPAPVLLEGTEVSWSLDAAPAGMTINSSTGAVSWSSPVGSPTPYDITVRATNIAGTDTKTWQLTVLDKPIIQDITDESVVINDAYTGPVPVLTQGALPIVWSLISAPAGMTIDANTGQVDWPSASIEGVHTITIRATNVVGSDDESWQLKVWAPPVVAEIADHAVTESVEYNGPAPALSSGTTPVSWSLDTGPAGMTIAADGIVTWPDPQPEDSEHTVIITATNLAGSDSESWSIRVMVPPQIDTISDEIVHEGTAYTGPVPQLLAGTAPITWSIVSGPSGLTINPSTGVVSWANVSGVASPYTITIRASNAVGSAQQSWQMTVLRLPLIVPIPDISVAVGSAYTGPTPSLYQGAEPINWALSSGPAGMTINNTTGVVSWPTVISGGPYAVIIEASNIVGSDTEAWQITVVEPPVIADIANMTIASGVPFTSPAAVLLGGTEVSWSLDDGPAGMTINPSTGAVSWSSPVSLPTPYNITVRATNIAGTDTKTWQLTVLDKPLIADVADHNAIEMIPYLGPLPVLDAGASPITWSLVTAPAGMTINTATGQVQWPNPVVAGSPHNITIRAENEVGSDDEAWQLQVPPSYGAEVWAGVETAVSPEPVTLSGQAYWLDSDINAPNVPVRVDILVKGISRNIALTADSNGQFTTTLVPLPGEGGVYHIGASHLYGVHTTDQDSFTIYGMRSAPATRNIWLYPSQPVSGTITLTNLTDVPLSGIIADVNGAAGNLDIQLDYDPNMSELAVIDVNYTITALDDSVLSSTVVINFSSNEGATASTTLNVNVIPLNFVVNVSPQSLKTGMVRGQQKLLQFDLSNSGGAPTGQLDVLIPQVPWLRLTTPQKIPQIGPGQTAAVGLALEPAENLPLGLYTGTIIVYGVGVNKVIPFEFNCISDKVGTLEITVVDEFTFYAAGAPNVEGASMTLRDVVTQNLAWAETTDVNGVLINENVTEGYYNLRITAEDHGSYNATVFVAAGTETEITAFMPRQLVKYSWTVTPTVIEDKYNITLNTIFETSVPAPVITISPARVDLAQLQNGMMQVNFVITNHGLVAAEEAHLEFEEDSRYEVVLLTDYNGRVEPQSSITVPAMIIDTEHPAMQPESSMIALETVSDDENCDTHFTGSVTYTIVCGDDKKWHYVPVYVGFWVCPGRKVKEVTRPNPPPPTPGGQDEDDEDDGGDDEPPGSTGGGTGSSTQKGGGGGVVGGGGGGGGGSGPGNPTVTYNFTEVDIEGSACDPCPAKRLAAIANCAVSFLPLNCPLTLVKGAYECASSCTTSGVWSLNCLKNCTGAVVGGVASCVKDLSPIGVAWNVIWCVIDIATACDSSSAPAYAEAVTHYSQLINHYYSTDMPPDPEYAAEVLKEQGARLQNIMEAITDIFGDPAWFSVDPCESGIQADLIEAFSLAIDAAGDANEWISEDEKAAMFVMPIPSNMTIADVNNTCERWNRTLDYWETGVFTASDLDPNANPDFIGADVYQSNWEMAADSAQECIDDGFTDILDGVDSALEDLEVALSSPSEGVCAKVALEVTQEAVMSRSAFEAVLDLTNQGESSLDNLLVVIDIEDANGNDSSDLFGIYPPTLSGISAVDGTADLPGGSNMKAEWIILPTSQAAPLEPVDYYIGGQIIYSIDGLEVILPLLPDKITVTPDANLVLDYFYQKEVYADDPFTEEVIEPNEPFSLGLIMSNNGAGAAYDVTIASAQPQIIRHEEDKDILVDFSLIGTQVGSAEMTPSLTVDLGDIAPYSTAVARWLMVSSLQGEFTSYNASFEHVDPLGDPRLSLISGINVHELIHVVRADYPADNNIVDFLVNDINDANGMPDTLYLDDGTIEPVDVFAGMVLDVNEQPTTVTVELSASVGSGWNYIRVPNPVEDGFYLVSATRSDSKPILTGYNAWVTNRVIREQDEEPYNERLIHIFDYAGSGSYTLIFGHEPIHGSLRVVLSPTEAVAAGAQWKLDDGSWMDSNDILDGISSGIHTVSFKEINDWIAPASGDVLITAGYTQELSASYLPAAAPVGSLVVTIEPQAAIDDGAYWQIDGSPIQYDSGDVVTGLATGTHSLTFASVEGWNEPNGQEVIIEAYQTTAASGVYTRIMYTLTVSADDSNGTVSDVSGEYEAGTVVLLNAYPNSGYRVKYWSGADYAPATGNNSNIVTMNSHKTVSVGFEPLPPDTYELDVQIIGNGDVQPDGGVYDEGTIVVLTAYPQDGYRVKSWTDADNVPAFDTNINTVTITENKTVVVEFELIPVTVPAISAVTPDSGPAGSYVRISGDNFGDVSGNVFFDVLATDELVSWQNSEIFCRVPFGLASPAFLDVDVVRADDVNCAAVDAFELFQSVTIYVDVNNISGMENGTMQYPFSRIQSAVNSSIDDCNIFVLAGVYTGPGNRDISIDKIISLQSLDGPTVTTIDCEGAGRAFYLHDISDPNCLIRGFTMQNGSVPGDGGLLYLHQAWPTIEQCILTGGMAGGGLGGAVFCDGSSPYLVNCTIVDNNSADGRALSCVSDSNCGTATIINCILENDGNEIYIEGCSTVAAAYSDIFGGFGGVGNIDEDPCFADAVNGDYHLAPYSPCIDAGDPNSDFSLEPEPDGGRINMGAYGNTQEATSNGDLVLQSYNLVSKVRVGRTEFDYAYTMTLYNDGDVNLVDVQVELIDTPANVVLIDSLVEFLSIDAHSSAVSDDTFTIRVNTLTPIDVALISWRATFTLMGTSITYTTNMHSNHLVLEPVFGDVTNDGLVNMEDLWRLSLYWLDFDPQSDIAPPPLGDGIVNALDFALMAENWMNE